MNHKTKKEIGHWRLYESYVEDSNADVDRSDELQKVFYSFDCETYEHALTLDFESLSSKKEDDENYIPPYQQKCVCQLGLMPENIYKGDSFTVDLNAEYVEQNDYAGIYNYGWLYSDNEKVSVTCNDGYAKGDFYAGDNNLKRVDKMSTSFTITVPEEVDGCSSFLIKFESSCGTSAFNYMWFAD